MNSVVESGFEDCEARLAEGFPGREGSSHRLGSFALAPRETGRVVVAADEDHSQLEQLGGHLVSYRWQPGIPHTLLALEVNAVVSF